MNCNNSTSDREALFKASRVHVCNRPARGKYQGKKRIEQPICFDEHTILETNIFKRLADITDYATGVEKMEAVLGQ